MTTDKILSTTAAISKITSAFGLVNPILAALPMVTTGVGHLIAWLHDMKQAGSQTGEWSPEMEAAFLAELDRLSLDPAFQPDKE